ncbi:Alpha/beta hydrolase fold-3 [Metarhizium album ARSEF 1941]|uniref:Alpha/beta hydrolase fold-3 n=1 Tax=Metarhizium album (strain ARSEF 1941) TaxID=1081103 RepID=A0A0B2WMU6_METAS|nr:Alpha/beta hydrolase fold-3 [Metarhizium album ARSEF 1941]KHN97391.1 Alpha/beta hydrolase fold-3 [Metarhizium album ARSEF 1941]
MRPKSKAKLSVLGMLDLLPGLASVVAVGILSVLTGLFRGQRDAPSLHLHIAYAVLRKATSRLSPLQLQFISPLTEVVYLQYARSAKVKPETVALGAGGARAHWLGNKEAANVLIWYHGGGFCLPANRAYFQFLESLVASSQKSGQDLAVFVLTYTLAPGATHPTQLTQAVEALRYILDEAGRRPSRVLIGGDSAGGNLVMGVLSHLAHRHPAIPELDICEPLAGAVGIAPWTLIGEDHGDRDIYCGGDLITPAVDKPWSSAFLGGSDKDYFTSASTAPRSWLAAFPVKRVLILGGGNEIMLPAIEDLAEKLQAALPNVELFIGHREAHVAPVYNMLVGDNTETMQGKKVKAWLRETL